MTDPHQPVVPGRIIAIGDIHGCRRALAALIEAVGPTKDDSIVLLGDMVDRGDDSRGVLDLLLELRQHCIMRPLLGNHEEMMLQVVRDGRRPEAWIRWGGLATLESYGFTGDLKVIPDAHLDFLEGCGDCVDADGFFFVHANYLPDSPLAEQPRKMLRWTSLTEHLPGPHVSGKIAVVGHTADPSGEVFSMKHLKCIDTYCYGGGWLTALDVIAGTVWQTNERGETRVRQL